MGCAFGLELPSSQGKKRNVIRCVIHVAHEKKYDMTLVMSVWRKEGLSAPYSPPQACCVLSPLNEGQDILRAAHQQP